MASLVFESDIVPVDRIRSNTVGVNRWLYFKRPAPKEIPEADFMQVQELYGIRSDGRMYRAYLIQYADHGKADRLIVEQLRGYLDQFLDCVAVTEAVDLRGFPNKVWHEA